MPPQSSNDTPVTVIKPSTGWSALNLAEAWRYRELLLIFAGRDIKVRYKQTFLGIFWVIIQPLTNAIAFWLVFGKAAKLDAGGAEYDLAFAFVSMLGWTLFAGCMGRSSGSVVGSQHLISKVYFPRILIPIAGNLSAMVDFAIATTVALIMVSVAGHEMSLRIFAFPILVVYLLLFSTAIGFWVSALSAYYRDFLYTVPFLTQAFLFASPVAYSTAMVLKSDSLPDWVKFLYGCNPVAIGVEGIRWSFLGSFPLSRDPVLIGVTLTLALFVGGLFFYKRMERKFADVL